MSKFFYGRLALTNLKSNRRTYYPYIMTAVITVVLFFNIAGISFHPKTIESATLASFMWLGTIITGIFSIVLLFYTNSFLMKRRNKEFGLFNILGMNKGHIGRVMAWETIYVGSFSITFGLGLGIAFNKLITLLLYKTVKFTPDYSFNISPIAIALTLALFCGIFLLVLLNSLRQVHFSKPIELLKGSSTGEKEPKTKWLMTLLGFITLGIGYYISLFTDNPLEAFTKFFLAVLLVILGTYLLFTAGSIAALKGLKKNKSYYYKTNHFTSVSGMIYRMKRNAAGLATICILSTAVLVMVSSGVSLYLGPEDVVEAQFPADIMVTVMYNKDVGFSSDKLEKQIDSIVDENGYTPLNKVSNVSMSMMTLREGNAIGFGEMSPDNAVTLNIMTIDEYNKLQGASEALKDNEVIVHDDRNIGLNEGEYMDLLGTQYKIKQKLNEIKNNGEYVSNVTNVITAIIPNEKAFLDIYYKKGEVYGHNADLITYRHAFNIDGSDEEKINLIKALQKHRDGRQDENLRDVGISFECKQEVKERYSELYGGFFFLCMFLGAQFLMATVLIIYYKQVVEGYEDRERFIIMRKVGMSDREVKKSIRSQILTVFALPLAVAAIHVAAAFPILSRLLKVLNLTNVPLFIACTAISIGVFAVGYIVVYTLTAKVYYRIINSEN